MAQSLMVTSKHQTALPGPALPQFQCETQTRWYHFWMGGKIPVSESASASFQGSGEKRVMIHLTDFRPFFSRESLP